jgi:hypothetical protein
MADINEGINSLNQSLKDLGKLKHDADPQKIEDDWNAACQKIDQAKDDLAEYVQGDEALKSTAMKAFAAFKQAEADPTHHAGLNQLCSSIRELISQLKEKS